jgi:hypothetical protein
MTIRFNLLAGCESGIVKGIDTTNSGIYVVHKPAETYADAVNLLEWSLDNNETDYMQVKENSQQRLFLLWSDIFIRHLWQQKRIIFYD